MTMGDKGNSNENSISTREEMIYDTSQMPYLVGTCLSAEEAKDLACRLIDSGPFRDGSIDCTDYLKARAGWYSRITVIGM